MSVMSASAVLPMPERRLAPSVAHMCALETRYAFLGLLRLPHYSMATIGFPVMFYLLFGLSFGNRGGGVKASEYLLAGYAIFGMITAALFALWRRRRQRACIGLAAAEAGGAAASVGVPDREGDHVHDVRSGDPGAAGGARRDSGRRATSAPGAWLQLAGVVALGCIPFCLIGLALGCVIPPSGAPGIVNIINLPLAFASGLWMPYEMLPKALQAIAPFVPQFHVGRLALIAVGLVNEPALMHVAMLALFSVVGGLCAAAAYRRASREF